MCFEIYLCQVQKNTWQRPSLPSVKKKHSAKTFFVVCFFGTRQRSSLPSAKLKTLGKKKHSAKKILALGKEASLVPEKKRSANHLALGKV
jgi:hypothetical protein